MSRGDWPDGWRYIDLPLATWQRINDEVAFVEWSHLESDADNETVSRITGLFDVVLNHNLSLTLIIDLRQMTYKYAFFDLRHLLSSIPNRDRAWRDNIKKCHIVIADDAISRAILNLVTETIEKVELHVTVEMACQACNVEADLVI